MKIVKVFIVVLFLFIGLATSMSFIERKNRLIKVLQAEVGYHSSYSYHHRQYRRKGRPNRRYPQSASVENPEKMRRRVLYGAVPYDPSPAYYNEYPGAYQPYHEMPYGYSYYTTAPPAFNLFG